MPPIEQTSLYQYAVYWANTFTYDAHGQEILASPIQIRCRFLDTENNANSPQENQIDLNQQLVVDRYIPPKSHIWVDPYARPASPTWKGAIYDWNTKGQYDVPNNLLFVKTSTNTPDVKGIFYFRTLQLMRLADMNNIG